MGGAYSPLVPIMLFGWLPIGLMLFAWLRPLRGIIAIYVAGWLLLPVAGYKVEGLPALTKMTSVTLTGLIAVLLYDARRLASFRPSMLDLPMFVWCTSPAISCLLNGLGPMDGVSTIVDQVLNWGLPYLMGRIYFNSLDSVRQLALGIVLGGCAYAPLCLYEIVMSPQLHTMFYGFYPHQFLQAKRFGGWRPSVFLQHGLAVGLYMCSAALAAVWLWRRRVLPRLFGFGFGLGIGTVAVTLVAVAVACKSTGAVALLLAALGALWLARTTKRHVWFVMLVLFAPAYVSLRAPGLWSGQSLIELAESVDDDRASSLRSRINSENRICANTQDSPVFGHSWTGFMSDDSGRDLAVMDGYWIISYGKWGAVGIGAMMGALLLPVLGLLATVPGRVLYDTEWAPAVAVAALCVMFVVDCLFNAMPNPMYVLAAGGVAGLVAAARAAVARGRASAAGPGAAGARR